eukprot:COSAG02_NODE_24579_length_683_cov_2.065068_2_plen_113_part_01
MTGDDVLRITQKKKNRKRLRLEHWTLRGLARHGGGRQLHCTVGSLPDAGLSALCSLLLYWTLGSLVTVVVASCTALGSLYAVLTVLTGLAAGRWSLSLSFSLSPSLSLSLSLS